MLFIYLCTSYAKHFKLSCWMLHIMNTADVIKNILYLPWRNSPQWAKASSLSRIHHHIQTHHIRWNPSGRAISPTQRPPHDNTQHSQTTDIHHPGGIRTHNPRKRAVADPRLRLRGIGSYILAGFKFGRPAPKGRHRGVATYSNDDRSYYRVIEKDGRDLKPL